MENNKLGTKKVVRVMVKELSSIKPLDFYTDLDNLSHGDLVVVDTRAGVYIGEVVDFPTSSEWAWKWVICKIDAAEHYERIARIERKEAILVELEAKRTEATVMSEYEKLSLTDESVDALLKELATLNGEKPKEVN